MPRFKCPCGQVLSVEDEHAGQIVVCPACNARLKVPGVAAKPSSSKDQGSAQKGSPQLPGSVGERPPRPKKVHDETGDAIERPGVPRRRPRSDEDEDDVPAGRPRRRSTPAVQPTSVMAIVSLVLGVLSCCLPIVLSLPALIVGVMGWINISKGRATGLWLAIAGVALGLLNTIGGAVFYYFLFTQMVPQFQRTIADATDVPYKQQNINNLKQIALAMHNYNDVHTKLPAHGSIDERKRHQQNPDTLPLLLSWRVQLLPYLGQDNLFRQFKLDEPWDSPHNIKLLPLMPPVYHHPKADFANMQKGLTHYQVFVGKDIKPPRPPFLALPSYTSRIPASFPDGASNTILIAEATNPVPWTKPADLVYDPNGPLPPIGGFFGDLVNVALADGSTRSINRALMPEAELRKAITADDGMPFQWDGGTGR